MKKYNSLDVLKFIGSIGIVFGGIQVENEYYCYIDFTNHCYLGITRRLVYLFFIISGFLSVLNINQIRNSNFKSYFIRKAKRIYPMATITTTFCLMARLLFVYIYRWWSNDVVPSLWFLINNYLLTYYGGFFDFGPGINGSLWYVCALLICYCFLFAICKTSKTNRDASVMFTVMVAIGIVIDFFNINVPYFNNDTYKSYCTFFTGALLSISYQGFRKKNKNQTMRFPLLLVVIICILNIWLNRKSVFVNSEYFYFFVFFPSVLLLFLSLDDFFKSKLWPILGGVSFNIYVWMKFFFILMPCIDYFIANKSYRLNIQYELFVALIIVGFSTLSYFYIEIPISGFVNKYLSDHHLN